MLREPKNQFSLAGAEFSMSSRATRFPVIMGSLLARSPVFLFQCGVPIPTKQQFNLARQNNII